MKRSACSSCRYDDLRMFLDLGLSPVADNYVKDPSVTPPMYPLQLAVCTGCWLVQLLEVVDHNILFGAEYSFYSSASAPLSAYHKEYADWILSTHDDRAKGLTVEIGCNDGDLLRHFAIAGRRALGVDPSDGPVSVARERGLEVLSAAFDLSTAMKIRSSYGPASIVIANHVLAHVADVSEVLAGITFLLAKEGLAFIEVQYLPDLLVNNAFDLAYHEHRNFFSLTSLETAAQKHGLRILGAALTNRQGGSLRVSLGLDGPPKRVPASVSKIKAPESWLTRVSAYDGMQGRAERIKERLWDLITAEKRNIIGYGAPAKATTLLNFCQLDWQWIDCVIDTTPAKQGLYIPGTGIQIKSRNHVGLHGSDTGLLLAWNYAEQIIRKEKEFRDAGGRWIVPIPAPFVV